MPILLKPRVIDVAHQAVKTEHAGPKKGKGGYAGRKRDAKHESDKARRRADAMAVDEELSPEWQRELKRRIADLENPVRYVVFSDIFSGSPGRRHWRLWLDVSTNTYGMSVDQATLFKREHVAKAVAEACSEDRPRDLLVAKITTKNGKRRVLKYER